VGGEESVLVEGKRERGGRTRPLEDLVVRERTGERRKRGLVCVLWHVKSESTRTSKGRRIEVLAGPNP